MGRVLFVLLIIVVLALIAWAIASYVTNHKNDPHRGLSRKDRREIARRRAQLELNRLEQEDLERLLKSTRDPNDPNNPNSDVWKGL